MLKLTALLGVCPQVYKMFQREKAVCLRRHDLCKAALRCVPVAQGSTGTKGCESSVGNSQGCGCSASEGAGDSGAAQRASRACQEAGGQVDLECVLPPRTMPWKRGV